MTNYLDTLVARVSNATIQDELRQEIARLRDRKDFGLTFERHLPETVRLPAHAITPGCKVQDRADTSAPIWTVTAIEKGKVQVSRQDGDGTVSDSLPAKSLIVIREFGETVYPGFRSVGTINRGGDKPVHPVINAENYHALEALRYAFEGRVDCIYIDPPYNTGDRNWQYNNNYVDGSDAYRHSKWLSFMERRLRLAKRLLRPEASTLVVTIDACARARRTRRKAPCTSSRS